MHDNEWKICSCCCYSCRFLCVYVCLLIWRDQSCISIFLLFLFVLFLIVCIACKLNFISLVLPLFLHFVIDSIELFFSFALYCANFAVVFFFFRFVVVHVSFAVAYLFPELSSPISLCSMKRNVMATVYR